MTILSGAEVGHRPTKVGPAAKASFYLVLKFFLAEL
jgi:hypothetical protein